MSFSDTVCGNENGKCHVPGTKNCSLDGQTCNCKDNYQQGGLCQDCANGYYGKSCTSKSIRYQNIIFRFELL